MMTGQLIVNAPQDKHTRITFDFFDGSRLYIKISGALVSCVWWEI